MPDATPPLTAPGVVAGLLADVAERDERLAEVTAERDKAYRERAHLVAHLAACHPSVMLTDSAEPDWPIVFVSTSAGQMSWHIAKADLELFGHVPATTEPTWDGHTTEEKYRRLAELVRTLSYLGPPEQVDAGIAEGKLERALAANQRWAETLGDVQQAGRERDDARSAFAKLAGHFTQGAQSGWTARISGTVLRRLCAAAGCEPPSGATDKVAEVERPPQLTATEQET